MNQYDNEMLVYDLYAKYIYICLKKSYKNALRFTEIIVEKKRKCNLLSLLFGQGYLTYHSFLGFNILNIFMRCGCREVCLKGLN